MGRAFSVFFPRQLTRWLIGNASNFSVCSRSWTLESWEPFFLKPAASLRTKTWNFHPLFALWRSWPDLTARKRRGVGRSICSPQCSCDFAKEIVNQNPARHVPLKRKIYCIFWQGVTVLNVLAPLEGLHIWIYHDWQDRGWRAMNQTVSTCQPSPSTSPEKRWQRKNPGTTTNDFEAKNTARLGHSLDLPPTQFTLIPY